MAISENIALLGFVLFVLGGARLDFYLFAVPVACLILVLFPREGPRVI